MPQGIKPNSQAPLAHANRWPWGYPPAISYVSPFLLPSPLINWVLGAGVGFLMMGNIHQKRKLLQSDDCALNLAYTGIMNTMHTKTRPMAGLMGLFDQKSVIAVTTPIATAFKLCIGHRKMGSWIVNRQELVFGVFD
jgi:hypothetical protein